MNRPIFKRFNHVLVAIAAMIFLFPVDSISQNKKAWNDEKFQQLEKHLLDLHEKKQFNGTILIAENGKVRFHKSIGFSNMDLKRKLDEQASFRLASVSKQFTCMGIMLLKQAGKINYDDAVVKYLPTFPYKNITVRHLMNHTSGLPDYMLMMLPFRNREKSKPLPSNKDVLAQFAKDKPKLLFKPGEKYTYSNSGYVVLGHLIEKVAEQPLPEFFEKSIFKPLGMKDSHVFQSNDRFQPKHRVYGFRYTSKGHREHDHHFLNGMVGDGGIYASALDLLKWDQALYGEKLVSQKVLQEAFQPGVLNNGKKTNYGFGWQIINRDPNQLRVSHGGAWVGFITYIDRKITEKRTLIILTNHSSRHLDKVMRKIGELSKAK